MKTLFATALLASASLLTGCQNSAFKGTPLEDTYVDNAPTATVAQVTAMYQAGDYQNAFEQAQKIARDRYGVEDRYEAAYIAGLSAQALGKLPDAEWLLNMAMGSKDQTLAVDAADALGLVYSQRGRYDKAQRVLLWAAERLEGERRAKAYYYAGIAQQKLGQWSQARTTLVIARSQTKDAGFREQINQQVNVTGWTLQLGAYNHRELARQQAESIAARSRDMKLGLPRLVDAKTAGGNPITLVQVGQFTSYQSATRYRDALGTPGVIIKAMP